MGRFPFAVASSSVFRKPSGLPAAGPAGEGRREHDRPLDGPWLRRARRATIAAGRLVMRSLALWLALNAATPAQPLQLPVGADHAPTHSELVRTLGEPPHAEVRPERLEPKPRPASRVRNSGLGLFPEFVVVGGEFVLSYPALGLVVTIDRDDRPLADPPIRWISMTAPALAAGSAGVAPDVSPDVPTVLRTPQGLFIGQPRQEALAIASRHFGSRSDSSVTGSVSFAAESGRALAWMRPVYVMLLSFDQQQRLRDVHYEFKPGLTRQGKWALAGAAVLVAALAAWALQWLWQHKLGTPSLPVASAATTRWVGGSIMAAGALVGVGSTGALGFAVYVAISAGWHPSGGMAALILGNYATVGLLMAAVLWFVGRVIARSA